MANIDAKANSLLVTPAPKPDNRRGLRVCGHAWALATLSLLVACSTGARDGDQGAWNPTAGGEEEGGGTAGDDGADDGADDGGNDDKGDDGADDGADDGVEEGGDGNEGVMPQCEPGEMDACLCPDGLQLGDQTCDEDGFWGQCGPCDATDPDDGGDATDGGTEGGDDGVQMPEEVCYPGADEAGTTCFPLHYFTPATMPAGYDYPGGLGNDPNYRDPIAFIDLEENADSTFLAPNFRLSEIAQLHKGRWAIVQPHAIESLQLLRDDVGAINVNSGYRSPDYNAGVDGATYSRHMYGDGFDLDPVSATLSALESSCESNGGMLVEYTTHVHCDFRFDDAAVEFFGPAPASMVGADLGLVADLHEDEEGVWTAPTIGFDEGEPRRRWQAFDAGGELIATGSGPTFTPPFEARSLEVRVGRIIDLVADL